MNSAIQHNLLEADKQEAVARDGLPRVARYLTTYADGSQGETQHVLYRPNGLVQSMPAADWLAQRGPLPTDPTQAQIDAAIAAQQQATQQAQSDAAQLRQQVVTLAQSTVGLRIDATFTAAQLKALLALLLWQAGALNSDGTVRPLTDWIDRRR